MVAASIMSIINYSVRPIIISFILLSVAVDSVKWSIMAILTFILLLFQLLSKIKK